MFIFFCNTINVGIAMQSMYAIKMHEERFVGSVMSDDIIDIPTGGVEELTFNP